jgi:lactoylglutathione lyase
MNPIVHLSLRVAEVQKAGDFYQKVFGFKDAEARRVDGPSRRMTDGVIDLTLTEHDTARPARPQPPGAGPCIHQFALEVDNVAESAERVKACGCQIISDPGVLPVQFRAAGGNVAELVPAGRHKNPVIDAKIGRIVHIALKVDDVVATGEFYRTVFGFRDALTERTRERTARHMTDGRIDFSLIQYHAGAQSAEARASAEGPCIHHFAVEVEDVTRATAEVKAYGCRIISGPGMLPVKFYAPGGTVAELVPAGRYQRSAAEAVR